jgi:Kef-type K+ transport system membrane component KefB/nucleotide-binding universal stress UspA family protein
VELPALSNHQLVVLWVELAALLAVARVLGNLARRLGQPAVVGELLAGLVLGPSIFGHIWPDGFAWFLPAGHTQGDLLLAISNLCLVLLVVVIGAETDLPLIASLGRAAALVSTSSLVVPFVLGFGVAALVSGTLIGTVRDRVVFDLLMAGAMAVSSLPIIARIIGGLGATRRDFGQLALAAGTVNDTFGFLVIALATALVGASGPSRLAGTFVGLVGLVVVLFILGQRTADALLRRARRDGPDVTGSLVICVIAALAVAAAAQGIGVEGALGGFVAGVILGRSRFQQSDALAHMERFSSAFFAPVYFATAGLRVNLGLMARPSVAIAFGALLVTAAASKALGSVAGARTAHLGWRESAALGIGLNGRGTLQVIIASAGVTIGVFGQAAYTVVILLSLATSVVAAPLLAVVVRDWHGTDSERQRLEHEERLERNVVVRGQRLLLPTRGSPNSIVAAEVLHCAWPEESPVTILSIDEEGQADPPDTSAALEVLHPRKVERRHISSAGVLDAILAEALLGYGAMGLGATDDTAPGRLLSLMVDDLVVRSPIPLVIVRRARNLDRALPPAFARVLVPVAGTASSRAAQEVACNISSHLGTAVVLLHVVTRPDEAGGVGAEPVNRLDGEQARSATGVGHGVLDGAREMARELGVEPETLVRHGLAAGPEIVAAAQAVEADLLVLGTTARLVGGQPFLGHTVEHVLANSVATVVVVVRPDPTRANGARAPGGST